MIRKQGRQKFALLSLGETFLITTDYKICQNDHILILAVSIKRYLKSGVHSAF